MLKLVAKQPFWCEVLPGVEIEFLPVGNLAWRAARRAAAAVIGRAEAELTDDEIQEEAGDAFSRALIERGIRAWKGVGDADGNPIEPTPEAVALFLEDPRRFEACDNAYVLPIVLEQQAGNVSAASPDGTSNQVTAAQTIATSAAKAPRGARSARTGSTKRAPKKKRSPGKRSRAASGSSASASIDPSA